MNGTPMIDVWLVNHMPAGALAAVLGWLGYSMKRRDKRMDDIQGRIDEMPFVYAMKDDVHEIKVDIKDIKKHLMKTKH